MDLLPFLWSLGVVAFTAAVVGFGVGRTTRPDLEYAQWVRGYGDGFRHALAGHAATTEAPVDLGLGRRIVKVSGSYGGPGIVRGAAMTARGEPRVIVGHQLADGFGELLHIYRPQDISPVAVSPAEEVQS